MSLGTLLTIFVVPTIYTLFARKQVPGELLEAEHPSAPLDGGGSRPAVHDADPVGASARPAS